MLPTFLLGGAPKAGTTALWHFLDAHPQVCMARVKEPRFFSQLEGDLEHGRMGTGPNRSGRYGEGLAWYASLFDHCTAARAIGEASTYYLAAADAPALIARHLPDVKLVFMLREPVRRAYSHYWQEYKLGWEFPAFEEMVRAGHPRLTHYVDVSSYAQHLERYRAAFGRDRIHVIISERFRRDPERQLRDLCAFLGIDYVGGVELLQREHNQQTVPKLRRLQQLISAAHGSVLPRLLPRPIRSLLGRARRRITRLNSSEFDYPPLADDLRRQLSAGFERDVAYVEGWLGGPLPEWR